MLIRVLFFLLTLSQGQAATVHLSILNKISAKKTPLTLKDGESVPIHDLIIRVEEGRHERDSFDGSIDFAVLNVFLNQEEGEPILLYQGEICSSTRYPQPPLEHSLYDVMLDYIED